MSKMSKMFEEMNSLMKKMRLSKGVGSMSLGALIVLIILLVDIEPCRAYRLGQNNVINSIVSNKMKGESQTKSQQGQKQQEMSNSLLDTNSIVVGEDRPGGGITGGGVWTPRIPMWGFLPHSNNHPHQSTSSSTTTLSKSNSGNKGPLEPHPQQQHNQQSDLEEDRTRAGSYYGADSFSDEGPDHEEHHDQQQLSFLPMSSSSSSSSSHHHPTHMTHSKSHPHHEQEKRLAPLMSIEEALPGDDDELAEDEEEEPWIRNLKRSTGVSRTSSSGAGVKRTRNYDVPQIECPPADDGMERFACPTPDNLGRYRCVDDHVLCDGFVDCPGREDEDRQACMFYKTTKAHLDVLADALLRWARGRR